MQANEDQGAATLGSWKEIAAFLGVNVRTAQRWEAQRGMPVRRFPGDKGRVAADPAELAGWQRRTLKEPPALWRNVVFLQRYSVTLTVVVALMGIMFLVKTGCPRTGPPAAIRIEFRTLIGTDAAGHELWRKNFPDPLTAEAYSSAVSGRTVWFGDIDGDGDTETVFAYHPASQGRSGSVLYCFSSRGREKWRFAPGKAVSDGVERFDPIYDGTDFVVTRLGPGGGYRVVMTSHQASGHPNHVAALDGAGKLRGEYWHSGHLDGLAAEDLDGDGTPEILLAGVDNARRAATLVVLDLTAISGASDAAGSPLQLQGLPKAKERAVIWFPRTCVNRVTDLYNIAKNVRLKDTSIEVYVEEKIDDLHCATIYTLSRDLRVTEVKVSDRLQAVHAQLRREGKLDHDLSRAEVEALRNVTRR